MPISGCCAEAIGSSRRSTAASRVMHSSLAAVPSWYHRNKMGMPESGPGAADLQDLRERIARLESESEQRFQQVADTAPLMLWMSGLDAQCTFFNRPWLEFRGRAIEQELGNG